MADGFGLLAMTVICATMVSASERSRKRKPKNGSMCKLAPSAQGVHRLCLKSISAPSSKLVAVEVNEPVDEGIGVLPTANPGGKATISPNSPLICGLLAKNGRIRTGKSCELALKTVLRGPTKKKLASIPVFCSQSNQTPAE